ncbi:hypothetical protein NBRGN_001_00060 [Nocardia brasiliensis NBRC 14402]|nr:hypothetical protein NBRGN_001_00060 [Nocardia brasiliensis NBRC 14402]
MNAYGKPEGVGMASIQVREILMGPGVAQKEGQEVHRSLGALQRCLNSKTFDKRGRYDIPDPAEYFESKIEGKLRYGEYIDLTSEGGTPKSMPRNGGIALARKEHSRLGSSSSITWDRSHKLSLAQVQCSDICDWTDLLLTGCPWCERKPIQLSTTSLYLQHLTTLLQIAVDDGLILENAASKFKLDKDDYEEGLKGPTATAPVARPG